MDKEEMKKKIQMDNKGRDEREKYIDNKSEVYASIVVIITLLILIVTSVIRKTDILGYITIVFAGVFGEVMTKFIYGKKIGYLIGTLISGIIFIICLVCSIMGQSFIIDINM